MASDPNKPATFAAKRDAAQNDGFLREVDEALREEQVTNSIRRYGIPLAAIVGVGLVGLAGYLWYDNSQKSAAAEKTEALTLALDKLEAGQIDAAAAALGPLAKDDNPGAKASAAMALAAIAQQQGRSEEAAKRFSAIAADPSMPQAFRDLATLREATITFDSKTPDQVIALMKPLAVQGKPFFGSAGELLAMAYLAQGKNAEAGALMAQIGNDKTVPNSIRSRARQVASGLGYDGGVEQIAVAPPGAPAGPAPAQPVQQ